MYIICKWYYQEQLQLEIYFIFIKIHQVIVKSSIDSKLLSGQVVLADLSRR